MCSELQAWEQGTIFQMILEHQGLFSALDVIPPRSYLDGTPLQSLDDLMETGVFLRTNHQKFGRPDFFNPKQKKALVLKMAYCLRDSFDTEAIAPSFDGNKIFLVSPPGIKTQDGLLYMSVANGAPHPSGGLGDPVLTAFAKLLLEIEDGSKLDIGQCNNTIEQWAKVCERAFATERAGRGPYADAVRGCLYLHLHLRPDVDDPATALRKAMREQIVGQLVTALNPPTAAGGKRRQSDPDAHDGRIGFGSFQTDHTAYSLSKTWKSSGAELDMPSSANDLPHLGKKQLIGTAPKAISQAQTCPEQISQLSQETTSRSVEFPGPFCEESSLSDKHTYSQQNPNRGTVFRARQVTLEGRESVSDVVGNIVRANICEPDNHGFEVTVRDILPRHLASSRGAAVFSFRGEAPESFRAIAKSREIRTLADNNKHSMDVDAMFFGVTRLYEPPPGTKPVAEYAAFSPPRSVYAADCCCLHVTSIVAIHGLNGHPYESWRSKSADPAMWLHDYLPGDVPNCRIILYGYKSNILDEKCHPRHELFNQAERLNASLNNIRNSTEVSASQGYLS